MHVLGIPVSDIDLGSTRARYYYMLKYLPKGWTWEEYYPGAKGDVLYIQKSETKKVWDAVKDCKIRNIPIVYERDDFCKPWNPEHTKIMDACDAVTLITQGLMDQIKGKTKTNLYHVPSGFDYDVKKQDRAIIRNDLRIVTTYGRHANIEAVAPYYSKIKLKKRYICDRSIKCVRDSKFVEWKLDRFIKKVKKSDLVLITHAKNFRAKHKPCGRVIVAMSLGIPVIATPNKEIKKAFNDVGHPELLIKNTSDIKRLVKYLRPYEVREKISNDVFRYAWENWSFSKTSEIMSNVFKKVIDEKDIH